jgi:phage RecT family recombinase
MLATLQDKRAPIDTRVNSLRGLMLANKEKLAAGIGGLLTPDRVIQVACNSIRKNPALLDCTPASLFASIAEAATYGWVVDGIMGQASLVPFRNRKRNCMEVTLIPGYKGLRDLVRRSGEVDVTMDSVHEGDEYEYNGRFELPKHVYGSASDRRFRSVTHAYVVGHYPSGRVACFSWTAGECLAHRDRFSQNWQRNQTEDNPWHEKNASFRVMCMKTVLLDAIHRGEFPMSVESQSLANRAAEVVHVADTDEPGEQLLLDVEDVVVENLPSPVDVSGFEECTELRQVQEVQDKLTAQYEDEQSRSQILVAADRQRDVIRAARGERSNGNR